LGGRAQFSQFRYYRPTELKDALAILAEKNPVVLAGGTDLFPATDRPMLQGEVLDITGISALSGIGEVDGYTRIGAATKWSEIIAADLPPACNALKLSAREVGSVQIQNSGTIGGNLCNASPAADGVPPLLILDAEVELTSKSGRRTLPLDTFIKGNRRTDIADGESPIDDIRADSDYRLNAASELVRRTFFGALS